MAVELFAFLFFRHAQIQTLGNWFWDPSNFPAKKVIQNDGIHMGGEGTVGQNDIFCPILK